MDLQPPSVSIVFNSPQKVGLVMYSVEVVVSTHWFLFTGELSPVRAELEGYS
jgi:hypothetical protein